MSFFNPSDFPAGDTPEMTLRDYFAGQVLGAVYTRAAERALGHMVAGVTAEAAYRIADAMLAEREGSGLKLREGVRL